MGADVYIVPRVRPICFSRWLKTKEQHIESELAVNGATRAMQGSDRMRLRARVTVAGVRAENPEPLTPASLHLASSPTTVHVAFFRHREYSDTAYMQKARKAAYFARESHGEHALKPCSASVRATP